VLELLVVKKRHLWRDQKEQKKTGNVHPAVKGAGEMPRTAKFGTFLLKKALDKTFTLSFRSGEGKKSRKRKDTRKGVSADYKKKKSSM